MVGVAIAAILTGMALGPRTPATYIGFALLYLAALGAFFATFVAVEFEAVGGGGAAATKCMLLVCVSNVSSDLMAPFGGWVHDQFSVAAMLLTEAWLGIISIGFLSLQYASSDGDMGIECDSAAWPRCHDPKAAFRGLLRPPNFSH